MAAKVEAMEPEGKAEILLVDDQFENLVALEAVLGDLGQKLVRAQSGKAALKQILETDFAVILMDVRMPDMDGLEAATLIRQRDKSRHTPIIFMTAYGPDEARVSTAYSLGAVDYMAKPVAAEALRSKVAVFVELFKQKRELERLNEELRWHQGRLEETVQQLSAVLENLAEAVVVVDTAEHVVLRNRAAREMDPVGDESARGLLGKDPGDLLGLDDAPLPREEWPVCRALRGEHFLDQEVIVASPGGSRRHIAFNGSAVRDAEGNVTLGVIVCHDITQLRQLEQIEQYVSMISHDLRNPLTPIMGTADMLGKLLSRQGMEAEARAAQNILTSGRRMNVMIQELVDTARLESGRIEMRRQVIDLRQLIGDICERVGTDDDRRRLRVEAPDSLPPVHIDPDRIERVVVNLITNALKYSPPEVPVIVQLGEQDGEALVSVIDQGIGIDPEEQGRLFERFYRSKRTRESEGLGLGLYICHLIVQAYGGRIWVESEPGQGSTFSFSLPAAE